jgi:pimeloyl-ACP methyl ester carboxylesterase
MSEVLHEAALTDRYDESPVFLDAPDGDVFGIVSRPLGGAGSAGVIVLAGGGTPLTTSRNRVSVRMCRGLASLGYTALRMDYHGTGESSGTVDQLHLGRPFVGDVGAAVRFLQGLGVQQVVIVGTCFGSRTALAAAAELTAVVEVIALATPLRDFAMGERHTMNAAMRRSVPRYVLEALRPRTIRGMFDRRSRRLYAKHARAKMRLVLARATSMVPWSSKSAAQAGAISPGLAEAVERLVDRGVPLVFVYGEDEDYYREFRAASDGELAKVRARAGSLISVVTVPGRVHGFTEVAVQEAVIRMVLDRAHDRASELLGDADAATELA